MPKPSATGTAVCAFTRASISRGPPVAPAAPGSPDGGAGFVRSPVVPVTETV
jgi:hypothetical protein